MASIDIMRIDVPEGVLDLGGQLQGPMDELLDSAAEYVADAYRSYIALEGAVDTGALLGSVHVEGEFMILGERSKQVVADVGYSAVVEYGWTDRGSGQASYPGRFPAQQAITFFIDSLIGGQIRDAFSWRLGRDI